MMNRTKMETFSSKLIDDILNSTDPVEQAKVDAKMLLATKIADTMKAKGWRNTDLLKALNKETPSIISKWLSGTHNFTVDTLVELGHALGINLLDLSVPEDKKVIYYQSVAQKALTTCHDSFVNYYINNPKERVPAYFGGSLKTSLVSQKQTDLA